MKLLLMMNFILDDVQVYDLFVSHNMQHGTNPALSTIIREHPTLEVHCRTTLSEPVSYYAQRCIEKYNRSILLQCNDDLRDVLSSDNNDYDAARSILNNASTKFHEGKKTSTKKTMPLSSAFSEALGHTVSRRLLGDEISGISLGFDFFDKVSDGAQKGDLIVMSARPGVGKTHTLVNSANAAYDQKKNVLFCALS